MKIILATGGSGGHFFPALKVAEELREKGHEVFFCGSFGKLGTCPKSGPVPSFPFINISAKGLTFKSLGKFLDSAGVMTRAIGEAWGVLRKVKPDVVVGFGGYGSFAIVFSAVLFFRIPTLIHEQNAMPGKANAVLARMVKRIAVSFEGSRKHFSRRKTVLTGCPCNITSRKFARGEIARAFGLQEDQRILLVLGGSQGSQRINQGFLQAAAMLQKEIKFQVIHISGRKDHKNLENQYKQLGIPVALFAFLDKIESAYHLADGVISRAGAVSITEIAAAQIPAILIPYPHAGGHQKYNARVLSSTGQAQIIEEQNLSAEVLKQAILTMINQEKKISSKVYFPDAAKRLTQAILEVARA